MMMKRGEEGPKPFQSMFVHFVQDAGNKAPISNNKDSPEYEESSQRSH